MVNHYYFYCVDEDFGPFFLKFGSYFPYNAKLCINGHEYLKRQLTSITKNPASSNTTRRDKRFELKRPSTTPAISRSADASKIYRNCARSALRPTDVCSTSNASAMTASSAKHRSRTCKDLSPWMVNAPQSCASLIRGSKDYC